MKTARDEGRVWKICSISSVRVLFKVPKKQKDDLQRIDRIAST